jgi:hypothetical protein
MKDKNKAKKDIYDVGEILDINRNEINKMLKKRKWTIIVAIILTIISTLMLSGCFVRIMYMPASIHDFSWIWRLF